VSSGLRYSYSWTPATPRRKVTTSKTELVHLGAAYAVLTGCLLLVFSGNTYIDSGFALPGLRGITVTLAAVSALAALTAFVAHEMAHKVVAQRLGFWAEFRAWPTGLLMAAITAAAGFIFAAPGATMVGGIHDIDLRSWGRTSLAGPMTNLAFGALFYVASIGAYVDHNILFEWLLVLAVINAWFGTFNLLPFGPLDGHKVFRWSPARWAAGLALTVVMFAVSAVALYYVGSPLL
jgi:Zn-dependent protease